MGAALLARRNLREGRGDRRGALRFASASVVLGVAYEIARLSGNPAFWYDVFTRNLGRHLYFGLVIWIFYVAVEPYVRRLWPGTLVAWSRVLDGRFRDAMVGRDVLLGAVGGLGFTLLFAIPQLASSAGLPAPRPGGNLEVLGSYRALLQNALFAVQDSFLIPVAVLVAVLLFRVILRRPWLAYVAIFVVVGGVAALNPSRPQGLSIMCVLTLSLLVLTRLGLLAFLVGIVFSSWGHFALTVDTTSWFFPQSLVTMAGFAAIAAYGFWVSLGNQKVFKDTILDR
jgi:serine/threonine-protein kinase